MTTDNILQNATDEQLGLVVFESKSGLVSAKRTSALTVIYGERINSKHRIRLLRVLPVES